VERREGRRETQGREREKRRDRGRDREIEERSGGKLKFFDQSSLLFSSLLFSSSSLLSSLCGCDGDSLEYSAAHRLQYDMIATV
jgi:hypothetical protein